MATSREFRRVLFQPLGEFVDVLDELARAGRIRAFGGSNWTPARVDEANEYARRNGRTGFSILSNHFGLADALDRSEEHTSELQSRGHLVCRLLLEKKKRKPTKTTPHRRPTTR